MPNKPTIPDIEYRCGDVFKYGDRFWKVHSISHDGTIWAATLDMNPFLRIAFRVKKK